MEDQARFDRLRFVELKHGRISMLAILGHIVTSAGIRLPGEIGFGVNFADMKAYVNIDMFMFRGLNLCSVVAIFHFCMCIAKP